MVLSARQVVVLADADKIMVESPIRFATLKEVDVLITDARISNADRRALADAGIEVVVA